MQGATSQANCRQNKQHTTNPTTARHSKTGSMSNVSQTRPILCCRVGRVAIWIVCLQKYQLQSIVKKFKASLVGRALQDISTANTTAANIRRDIKQLVEPSNICCTPRVCIPIVPELLSVCVKGGFCTPNFEVRPRCLVMSP